jgi:hypothetical protein
VKEEEENEEENYDYDRTLAVVLMTWLCRVEVNDVRM